MSRKQIGIIIAAGLVFELIFGVRQSVALFIRPLNSATSTWMLVLLIGVVAAGGGVMAGLGVLMSAVAGALPPEKRGIASGMVNAGGSFGQFVIAPLAIVLTGLLGWIGALTALGLLSLAIVPLAFVLRGKHPAAAHGAAPEKSMKHV